MNHLMKNVKASPLFRNCLLKYVMLGNLLILFDLPGLAQLPFSNEEPDIVPATWKGIAKNTSQDHVELIQITRDQVRKYFHRIFDRTTVAESDQITLRIVIDSEGSVDSVNVQTSIDSGVYSAVRQVFIEKNLFEPATELDGTKTRSDLYVSVSLNKAGPFELIDSYLENLSDISLRHPRIYINQCETDSLTEADRKLCAEKKMREIIYENMVYPPSAKENKIQMTCVIRIIVDKNGDIVNPKIVRNIGFGLGKEALRLVRNLPRFIPAVKDGELVKVQLNLPVSFRLE